MVKLRFVIKNDTLVLRISEGKERFYRSAMSVLTGNPNLKHWNADKERFSCNAISYKENNAALEAFKKNYLDFSLSSPAMTAREVSTRFDAPVVTKEPEEDHSKVRPFLLKVIEREKAKPGCNFETYGKILRKCDKILPGFDKLTFQELDYDKCVEIAGVLAEYKGYAHSAKQFRNMLGKASKDRAVPFRISQIGEFNFSDYDPEKDCIYEESPDILTNEQVRRFLNFNPYAMTPEYRDRNTVYLFYDFCVFMLNSFMAPCDVMKLKVSDISDGKIRTHRKKTHRPVEVPVTSAMSRIIARYSGISEDGYVFPILDDSSAAVYKTRDYLQKKFGQNLNIWLKSVGKELETDFDMYAYVFRHTAITMALDNGLPISYVSAVAGTDIDMIQKYYYNGKNEINYRKLEVMFQKASAI